jgi:glutamate dehydrogenase
MVVREVFDLPRLWERIDALDGRMGGEAQLRLYEATRELVDQLTRWFLHNGAAAAGLSGTIARHKAGLAALSEALEDVLPPARKAGLAQDTARVVAEGVPGDLAADIARLKVLAHAPAIADIAQAEGRPLPDTARSYLEIGARLSIDDLARKGAAITTSDPYDRIAIAQALDQLIAAHAAFTREALRAGGADAWLASQATRLARLRHTLADASGEGGLTLSRLLVASCALHETAAGH